MNALSRPQLTRRHVLLSSVAACALLTAQRTQAATDLDKFMDLSRQLTGRDNLDPALGDVYLRAFDYVPLRSSILERLIDQGDDGSLDMRSIKQQILRQWYTGVVQTADGPHVATFEQALMWDAMGMQPVGYWSEPPAT